MKQNTIFIIIIIGFIIYVLYNLLHNSDILNLKCIISSVDGNEYCVRDRIISNEAADLLAKVVVKCNLLVNTLIKKKPDHPITKLLSSKYNPKVVNETLPTSSHTAYSENKGEKLRFCLSKHKHTDAKLIDINTLTFVALHELSHIATKSVGHTSEYWYNFKFILQTAVEENLYIPIDYKKEPVGYCGMTITDNPYYDV